MTLVGSEKAWDLKARYELWRGTPQRVSIRQLAEEAGISQHTLRGIFQNMGDAEAVRVLMTEQ